MTRDKTAIKKKLGLMGVFFYITPRPELYYEPKGLIKNNIRNHYIQMLALSMPIIMSRS